MKDTVFKKIMLMTALKVFPDREFISLFVWELKLFLIRVYEFISPLERLKVRHWNKKGDLKINLGGGTLSHPGWINVDAQIKLSKEILTHDLRRPLPLRDGCARYVFSEHFFEHITYPGVILSVLEECRRVLQEGGVLRVVIPDAERYLKAYVTGDWTGLERDDGDLENGIERVNKLFRENGFHKYAYDYKTFKKLLKKAGFNEVRLSSFRASEFDELNIDFEDQPRIIVSIYIEAQ